MINNNCRNCEHRHLRCHTDCTSYAEYRRKLESTRLKERIEKIYSFIGTSAFCLKRKGDYSRWR